MPFKSGAKILIERFNLKVQPVVVCGTRKCLDIGALKFQNTPFSVQYLPAFIPQGEHWFEDLKTQMQTEYSKMYAQSQNIPNQDSKG